MMVTYTYDLLGIREQTRVETLWGNIGTIVAVRGNMVKVLLDKDKDKPDIERRAAWYYYIELEVVK